MRRAILMIALAAVVALAGCGGGGGNPPAANPGGGGTTGTRTMITAANGGDATAATPAGNITVHVQAGGLAADTTITVTPVTAAPVTLPNSNVFLMGVTLGPSGTNFVTPVTITFPLPAARAVGSNLLVLLYDASGNPQMSPAGVATVLAGGRTARMTVMHFSTLLLTASVVADLGNYFTFSTGLDGPGAPADFFINPGGTSIQPDHSPAKTTTAAFDSITHATAGGYDLINPIAIQRGTVILFQGIVSPGYWKMVVTDITATSVSFVYASIAAPPSILGTWDIGGSRTLVIMASGAAYIADVHDGTGTTIQLAGGTLNGNVLSGNLRDLNGNITGTFSITFDASFTHFTGQWTGTKL